MKTVELDVNHAHLELKHKIITQYVVQMHVILLARDFSLLLLVTAIHVDNIQL